jgi:hypothetical protein
MESLGSTEYNANAMMLIRIRAFVNYSYVVLYGSGATARYSTKVRAGHYRYVWKHARNATSLFFIEIEFFIKIDLYEYGTDDSYWRIKLYSISFPRIIDTYEEGTS